MRIFKTRTFSRWARKEKVWDSLLCTAVNEMETGLIDANLGGGVYKKRVALGSRGKSGGARTVLAYQSGANAYFVFGFAKSERANIGTEEVLTLKRLAKKLLNYNAATITHALKVGELEEITND